MDYRPEDLAELNELAGDHEEMVRQLTSALVNEEEYFDVRFGTPEDQEGACHHCGEALITLHDSDFCLDCDRDDFDDDGYPITTHTHLSAHRYDEILREKNAG